MNIEKYYPWWQRALWVLPYAPYILLSHWMSAQRRAGLLSIGTQQVIDFVMLAMAIALSLMIYFYFKKTAPDVPIKPSRFSRPMQRVLIAVPLVLGAIAAVSFMIFRPWPEGYEYMRKFEVIFPAVPAVIGCYAVWWHFRKKNKAAGH